MSNFNPTTLDLVASSIFGIAVLHTFLVKRFEHLAKAFPEGSVGENLFHMLGEVEVVFGMWAGVLFVYLSSTEGFHNAIKRLEGLDYTEAVFVFVIMAMAGTRPILRLAEQIIMGIGHFLPFPKKMGFYISTLIIGPILGSFITEPAAMTVTALILLQHFYKKKMSEKFKYATLGLLFVNISIGGTLTPFAAPPVIMVAGKWKWGIAHMLGNFGYKAVISIVVCTLVTAILFKKELKGPLSITPKLSSEKLFAKAPVIAIHVAFLFGVVYASHHMVFFMSLFLYFLGFAVVTKEYQDEIKLRESLLVGFFLAGLITLGSFQQWWLQPVLGQLNDFALYGGATALTAITDNAALTYLGSLVPLSESAKYFLVAGAVVGGGLTVIANAPNPAGYGILKEAFGDEGISPLGLLTYALPPTIVAFVLFMVLPSFF